MTTFTIATVSWAGVLALLAFVTGWGAANLPDLWCRLPRNREFGVVLATGCFIWAAWHAQLLLEGDLARWKPLVWGAVPVLAVLTYYHLDFLLGRALGGFILLMVPWLLHRAFTAQIHGRALYSAMTYAWSLGGMLLVAMPWRLRDLLERCRQSGAWSRGTAVAFGLSSLFYVAYAILG